jgi:muramoyltetrapeptide carboxypeptidase
MGTPFEISTEGRILFLEDVAEKPYRLERGLDQLKASGKLERLEGVVLGDLSGWAQSKEEEGQVREIVEEVFSPYPYPVGCGLQAGHGARNLTLPLGVEVILGDGRLSFAESPLAIKP